MESAIMRRKEINKEIIKANIELIPRHYYPKKCAERADRNSKIAKESMDAALEHYCNIAPYAIEGVTLFRMFITGFHVPTTFKDPLTTFERNRVEALLRK